MKKIVLNQTYKRLPYKVVFFHAINYCKSSKGATRPLPETTTPTTTKLRKLLYGSLVSLPYARVTSGAYSSTSWEQLAPKWLLITNVIYYTLHNKLVKKQVIYYLKSR